MSYKMSMRDDGIQQITYIGDMRDEDAKAYFEEFMSFIETATEAEPLLNLSEVNQLGKMSPVFRKKVLEIVRDPRLGKTAVVGANRYARVLTNFFIKATRRDNLRFFNSEEEALAWLKAKS